MIHRGCKADLAPRVRAGFAFRVMHALPSLFCIEVGEAERRKWAATRQERGRGAISDATLLRDEGDDDGMRP